MCNCGQFHFQLIHPGTKGRLRLTSVTDSSVEVSEGLGSWGKNFETEEDISRPVFSGEDVHPESEPVDWTLNELVHKEPDDCVHKPVRFCHLIIS